MEFDVTCSYVGAKLRLCSHGWFEMGGAGVVEQAVFENVGIDPDEWTGFAWGLGLDRIAPTPRHPHIRSSGERSCAS